MCLFIIANTPPSHKWEAHHGPPELWPFLLIQRRSLYPAMDIQREGNQIKWRLFLLTHLQRVTTLPTGSYDDDDILTEAPRGHSRLRRFFLPGLRGRRFLLWGFFVRGNLDGVDDACGPLGWGWMRTFGCQQWGGLSGSVRCPQGRERERRHRGPGLNRQMQPS